MKKVEEKDLSAGSLTGNGRGDEHWEVILLAKETDDVE